MVGRGGCHIQLLLVSNFIGLFMERGDGTVEAIMQLDCLAAFVTCCIGYLTLKNCAPCFFREVPTDGVIDEEFEGEATRESIEIRALVFHEDDRE